MPSMSSRTINLTLLTVLAVEFLSGLGSFLAGTPDGQWVLWVHRAGGFALLPLLGWKLGVVLRSYHKRGLTHSTALSALLGVLFLGALLYGLLWSSFGVGGINIPGLGAQTGLGMHVALAVALVPLLIRHAVERWPQVRMRRPDFASRRAAIRYLALGTAGVLGWRATEAAAAGTDLPGSRRRFTGSQETGSLSGNAFPTTSWMTDTEPQLDPARWQLRIYGAVTRETLIGWDELTTETAAIVRATLDCTGGWYTEQDWSGVPVTALLKRAGVRPSARSLVFHSATGYRRRYPLDEAGQLLLATHVSGEALAVGHGYPVRLVAPGRRGYDSVKWVVTLEVSDLPSWLESPLPLQ